jgi:hypothetical protein
LTTVMMALKGHTRRWPLMHRPTHYYYYTLCSDTTVLDKSRRDEYVQDEMERRFFAFSNESRKIVRSM